MGKYQTLLQILDRLRAEAPLQYKLYHASDKNPEDLDYARSRAFIHLFLKVRHGLLGFLERESYVTDGSQDGGIDGYYIDEECRVITFIQAKFRTSPQNFEEKQINLKEILRMDADRISDGKTADESGRAYNGKVRELVARIAKIPDIARYKYEIVILANLEGVPGSSLRKLTGGFSATVFDFSRTYRDLVFPIVTGTFFNVADLFIRLNLTNKEVSASRINYPVRTEYAACNITILFVPTLEIAKTLLKYKNSILKFNPRGFLELSRNLVNSEIAETIKNRDSNEFALFNNGITMLSDETNLSERVGQQDKGQLHVRNPQIINGGQTAFTLSHILEDVVSGKLDEQVFHGKEVMLKVITLPPDAASSLAQKLQLIEAISKATNQQTSVNDGDRRSNEQVQVGLQERLFLDFGYFYERKRGEFADGLKSGYISRDLVIDREMLLRVASAISGDAAGGRRSNKALFKREQFDRLLGKDANPERLFLGYKCLEFLGRRERSYSGTQNRYGLLAGC